MLTHQQTDAPAGEAGTAAAEEAPPAKAKEAPAAKAKTKEAPAAAKKDPPAAMPYLGTLAPEGLRQAKKGVGVAGLPCVILGEGGAPLGVVVASNPSMLGEALVPRLVEQGLKWPFTQVAPTSLGDEGKLAAARAIMRADDDRIDKAGALATFGYKPSMLA